MPVPSPPWRSFGIVGVSPMIHRSAGHTLEYRAFHRWMVHLLHLTSQLVYQEISLLHSDIIEKIISLVTRYTYVSPNEETEKK